MRPSPHRLPVVLVVPVLLAPAACGSEEAPTVQLPVVTEGGAFAPVVTDLGYTVTTSRVRLAMSDLELTIQGEQHAIAAQLFHPGHSSGGDVTGTMPGDFIVDWDGTERALGTATLIVGTYQGANLHFRAAAATDELAAGDPLLGHTFHLTGTASKDGTDRPFDAVLDIDAGTALVGAVFEDEVTEDSVETLRLALLPTDPTEDDTIYDGLDFATLTANGEGVIEIRPGSTAHNVFRRPIQTHDHYAIHH